MAGVTPDLLPSQLQASLPIVSQSGTSSLCAVATALHCERSSVRESVLVRDMPASEEMWSSRVVVLGRPLERLQIILLGDRGTCVLTTCPGLHSTAERPGFKSTTCWSEAQHPNTRPSSHTLPCVCKAVIF